MFILGVITSNVVTEILMMRLNLMFMLCLAVQTVMDIETHLQSVVLRMAEALMVFMTWLAMSGNGLRTIIQKTIIVSRHHLIHLGQVQGNIEYCAAVPGR